MRDSRIGAYGASALLMSALIRWSAIAQLGNTFWVFCGLAAAHAASRALLPAFMHLLPPARQDGLAAEAGTVAADTASIALVIGAVALLALGVSGLVVAALCLAVLFSGFRALCMRQIGGQTGDTLGALQQLGEIAVLLVAAAVLT
jgi:adenosylcobinamide-GDP ribazoletransferase